MKTRYLLQEKKKAKCTSTHALRLSTFSTRKAIGALFVFLLAFVACLPMQAQAADTAEKINIPDGYEQNVEWSRLSGDNRLDTMASISKSGFDKADTVVVAAAGNFPDALSATSLAGYYKCPVLLTDSNGLSQQTQSEINRLGVKKAIVAGGSYAISNNVVTSIEKMGIKVERLSGSTRLETAEKIYNSLDSSQWSQTAIVASGETFADALSISPYTYAYKAPIFLTDGSGSLTDASSKILTSGKFSQVVIVGGTARISASTENAIKTKVGADNVIRLAGETRYDTSKEIVSWCVNNGLTYEGLSIAKGGDFPDALSGGALCGIRESVVMLVSENESDYSKVVSTLSDNKLIIRQANVLGGNAAVSTNLYKKLQESTLSKITNSTDQTDSKGIAEVTNKDGQTAVVTVSYDKDGNGNFITLSQVTVNANGDGTYTLDLPRCAKGKSVKANFVDKQTSKPITGAQVYVNDSGTNSRGSVNTDRQGNVSFEGSSGVTGKDGITEVVDINGNTIKATVTYDKDDNGTYVAVAGAKVTANDDGTYSIGIPDIAKAKDVKVNLENRTTGKPVADGTKVTLLDGSGKNCGTGETSQGEATFQRNTGTTGTDGKAEVIDKDGNTIQVLVEYDKNNNGSYVALSDAIVTADNDGSYSIDLIADAKSKGVKVTLTNSETGEPVDDGTQVCVVDASGSSRGYTETSNGVADFNTASGATNEKGVAYFTNYSNQEIKANVWYDSNDDDVIDGPLQGAKVSANADGSYTLNLPSNAKEKNVKVGLEDASTGAPVANGTKITAIDSDGANRGTSQTRTGIIVFLGDLGTTDKYGQTTILNPNIDYDESKGESGFVKATVTYSEDGQTYKALADAKVEGRFDFGIAVRLTDLAKSKDVQVKLQYVNDNGEVVSDFGAGTEVYVTDADGNYRGCELTDDASTATFLKNKGTTDKDNGITNICGKNNRVIEVSVSYNKNNNDTYVALADAVVIYDSESDAYSVELPSAAKNKDVKVVLKDAKKGSFVADGIDVSSTDTDGNNRGAGETKYGTVLFAKNIGITGQGGTTDVTDKDGNTTNVLVEYDAGEGAYTSLLGATVTVDEDGSYSVELSEDAKSKDVRVTLTDAKTGDVVADGIEVSAADADENNRGVVETKDGVVVFAKNVGVTDEQGKTSITSTDSKGSTTNVLVEYDAGNGAYVSLQEAKVTVSDDGSYQVDLPEAAKSKDVRVTLKDAKTGKVISDGIEVSAIDADENDRGTEQTNQGVVIFDKNTGATDSDGKTDVVDGDDETIVGVTVESSDDQVSWSAVEKAGVTANGDGSYFVTVPSSATDKNVKVTLVNQKTQQSMGSGISISAVDAKYNLHGPALTDSAGQVIFDKSSGITNNSGIAKIPNAEQGEATTLQATVMYDASGTGAFSTPLTNARIACTQTGGFSVELPDAAKGKSVQVTFEYVDEAGTHVSYAAQKLTAATDLDAIYRGQQTTDDEGVVVFSNNQGQTNNQGTTDVVDQITKELVSVTIQTVEDEDTYVLIAGAQVVANEDGSYDVVLPEDAKAKDVRATLLGEDGKAVDDGVQVSATDANASYRGSQATVDGVAEFSNHKGQTNEQGTTDVVDQKSNWSIVATVYVANDNGVYELASGVKVTSNEDETYSIVLPASAKGKNAKATFVFKNGKTISDGTLVSATDDNGNFRGSNVTEDGEVEFLGSQGETKENGLTSVADQKTKEMVTVTVYVANDKGTYETVAGAKVSNANGSYSIVLPSSAKGRDAKALLIGEDGKAVDDGTQVSTTDADANYRGSAATKSGVVEFYKIQGETKDDGKTDIIDQKSQAVVSATVYYIANGSAYVPLAGAKVASNADGSYSIDLPEAAKRKDIKATFALQNGSPIATGTQVAATDIDGNLRVTCATDSSGQVLYSKFETLTKTNGTGTLVDKAGTEVNVTLLVLNNSGDETGKIAGAKATARSDKSYLIELPTETKSQNIKVLLENKDGEAVEQTTVVITTTGETRQRSGITDDHGEVIFNKFETTTDKDGMGYVIDQYDDEVILSAYYEPTKGSGNFAVLEGAHIYVDGLGNWTAELPQNVKGKNVKIKFSNEAGNPYDEHGPVTFIDDDGGTRGSSAIGNDGWAYSNVIDINWDENPEETVMSAAQGIVYDQQVHTPSVVIKTNGTTLQNGTDYTVEYSNNRDAGTAVVKVTGMGSYYGSHEYKFTIARREITSVETSDTVLTYNGEKQSVFETAVYASGIKLSNDSALEYSVSGNTEKDSNNKSGTSTYTMKIVGEGNYCGEKTIDWMIKPRDISGAQLTLSKGTDVTYQNTEINNSVSSVTLAYMGQASEEGLLVEGDDYTVLNDNSSKLTHVGEASLTIQGTGNFYGNASQKWNIVPKDISGIDSTFSVDSITFTYDRTAHGPNIQSFSWKGEDIPTEKNEWDSYYVVYGDTSATNAGTYTLKLDGFGDYTGTKEVKWSIRQAEVTSLELNDQSFVYDGQTHTIGVVSVTSKNGLTLDASEYDISTNSAQNAGTYNACATGKGNFKGSAYKEWSIDKATLESVTFNGSLTYNGEEQTTTDFVVVANGVNVPLTECTISGNAGTNAQEYTATIAANEDSQNFESSIDCKWSIEAKTIEDLVISVEDSPFAYTGKDIDISDKVVIMDGETVLVKDVDYTLSDNIAKAVGKYTVSATGIGNYKDKISAEWEIK